MRGAQRSRRDSWAAQEAFSIYDIGQVSSDRQSQRSREYFRDQFLRIFRLVALADDLPLQVATFGEEGTRGPRLDAGPVFRKGLCLRHVESSGVIEPHNFGERNANTQIAG